MALAAARGREGNDYTEHVARERDSAVLAEPDSNSAEHHSGEQDADSDHEPATNPLTRTYQSLEKRRCP